MRRLAYGLLLVVAALPACSAKGTARRELEPLPGVTTPTTLITVTTLPGATVLPTTGPVTTGPVTTGPVTTAVSESTLPTTAPAGPRWTFGSFRSVQQLGSEPVRGSGCGADGTIGEVIPDGWWLGLIADSSATELQFDLVCAYYGNSAQPLIDECLASDASATCNTYFDRTFWPMNRNTRTRAVPRSPSFQINEVADLCSVGIETRVAGVTGELDWVLIENGSAVYMRRGCGSE